jgi:hypothetical protein
MKRTRIERERNDPTTERPRTLHCLPKSDATAGELLHLAAVLEQIAAMDALPLALSRPRRRGSRRCAT